MILTIEELEQFVGSLVASPERWAHLVRHCSDVRVYEQIWDDENVNAWLICWSEDQDTGFHDHDESSAAIAVISGQVREDRLRLGQPPRSRVLGPGSIFTVPAVAIHRVLHAGDAPAVPDVGWVTELWLNQESVDASLEQLRSDAGQAQVAQLTALLAGPPERIDLEPLGGVGYLAGGSGYTHVNLEDVEDMAPRFG